VDKLLCKSGAFTFRQYAVQNKNSQAFSFPDVSQKRIAAAISGERLAISTCSDL
jgi:hypothetical protein